LPRPLILVLLLGLTFRILFVTIHQRSLFSDEKEYDKLAFNLASKADYAYDINPTAYRPVGYPAMVGLVFFVAGHEVMVIKILQVVCDAFVSILLFLLLADMPSRARLYAALLWAVFLPAIFYTSLLLSETVFTFGFVVGIWLLARHDLTSRMTLFLLGAVFGLLTLVKPTVAVFGGVLLFLLPQINLRLNQLLLIAAAFFLVLSPWLARNYVTFGRMTLTSNGGINLMIGNNPASTGAYKYPSDLSLFHDSQGEFDLDSKALRFAANYIWSNPGATIINVCKKLGRLFESEGVLLVLTFHDDPESPSTHYLQKYASLPIVWILATNLAYFIIALAAIFGFLSASRDKLWWIALTAIISSVIVHAIFFGGGRFHFPLMPLLTIYAARCIAEPGNTLKSLTGHKMIVAAILSTLLCSLWIIEAYMVFHG
jgi:hypothetical protein